MYLPTKGPLLLPYIPQRMVQDGLATEVRTCWIVARSFLTRSIMCAHVGWMDANTPVAKWYKVGVLGSRVHSIVMSSNNMTGTIPPDIAKLAHLRMIELATMSGWFVISCWNK